MTKKTIKQKTIKREDLARLSFCNSRRLPQFINDGGTRREWVGIGWINCGDPQGDEVKVIG